MTTQSPDVSLDVGATSGSGRGMPSSAVDLGSLSAVRIAVISGSAPTVISRLAVFDDLASGARVEMPVDGLRIERRLMTIWQKRSLSVRLPQAFLAHLTTEPGTARAVPGGSGATGPNR